MTVSYASTDFSLRWLRDLLVIFFVTADFAWSYEQVLVGRVEPSFLIFKFLV
jgi:hypothetical protein